MTELFQVLTANRLADGVVVYGREDAWVERLEEAELLASKADAEARLTRAAKDFEARLVVEVYLFEVARDARGLRPTRVREAIRAAGPTVRADLGKQAEAQT